MSPDAPWKNWERRVADIFDADRRNPYSGSAHDHARDAVGTAADAINPDPAWAWVEAKKWDDPPAWDRYMDLRRKAKRQDREAVVVLDDAQPPTKGDRMPRSLVMVDLEEMVQTLRAVYTLRDGFTVDLPWLFHGGRVDHYVSGAAPYFDLYRDALHEACEEGKWPVLAVSKKGSSVGVGIVALSPVHWRGYLALDESRENE